MTPAECMELPNNGLPDSLVLIDGMVMLRLSHYTSDTTAFEKRVSMSYDWLMGIWNNERAELEG